MNTEEYGVRPCVTWYMPDKITAHHILGGTLYLHNLYDVAYSIDPVHHYQIKDAKMRYNVAYIAMPKDMNQNERELFLNSLLLVAEIRVAELLDNAPSV